MPKVGARTGLTIRLFKESNYEFVRPEISISDIDTDGDVPAQIKASMDALELTYDAIADRIGEILQAQMAELGKTAKK